MRIVFIRCYYFFSVNPSDQRPKLKFLRNVCLVFYFSDGELRGDHPVYTRMYVLMKKYEGAKKEKNNGICFCFVLFLAERSMNVVIVSDLLGDFA